MRERSPLLIHCRFDVGRRADAATPLAARLLADGCYCNGFEAARRAAFSAASALHGAPADPLAARRAWEHDLFSCAQRGPRRWLPRALHGRLGPPVGLAAADRPRYGELNLFEAPGGTAAAAALYGRSYIELAGYPELRRRCAAHLSGTCDPLCGFSGHPNKRGALPLSGKPELLPLTHSVPYLSSTLSLSRCYMMLRNALRLRSHLELGSHVPRERGSSSMGERGWLPSGFSGWAWLMTMLHHSFEQERTQV